MLAGVEAAALEFAVQRAEVVEVAVEAFVSFAMSSINNCFACSRYRMKDSKDPAKDICSCNRISMVQHCSVVFGSSGDASREVERSSSTLS